MKGSDELNGSSAGNFRFGIDIGGTFTDVIAVDQRDGSVLCEKVPSTPKHPAESIAAYFSNGGMALHEVQALVHGSTVAVNAIIEGRGARLGMLTTSGFKNRLDIQRSQVLRDFDFNYRKPEPLIPIRARRELSARTTSDGSVLREIEVDEVERHTRDLVENEQVEVICVCLLNSYANPGHESQIREIIMRLYPEMRVVCSSDMGEVLEYERFSTCAVNAFLLPVVQQYLATLGSFLSSEGLGADRFMVMQGNGGIARPEIAQSYPGLTMQSGPAAGVIASRYIGQLVGERDLLTFDMGGTSTDVCLIRDGEPYVTTDYQIEGHPFKFPLVDIHSVGAGGGSIAWVDEIGRLHVGPHSAGAEPGPACYGKGGEEPTISDAHAVLGRLRPELPLGGDLVIDRDRAVQAVARIAEHFDLGPAEAAARIIRIANENMANALRVVSVQKGLDPRSFTLVAYGGAGPMHAGMVMKILGMPRCIIPPYPGAHSAYGLAISDVRHDFVHSILAPTLEVDRSTVDGIFESLEERGRKVLASEGVDEDDTVFERRCDMRYIGQAYVPVVLPLQSTDSDQADLEATERLFHQLHRELYKHGAESEPTELISLRVSAIGRQPRALIESRNGSTAEASSALSASVNADVYFEDSDAFVTCPIYSKSSIGLGVVVEGPAMIAQPDSLILVYSGQTAEIDQFRNIILIEK